jgi:two-component sensor histidine kinase
MLMSGVFDPMSLWRRIPDRPLPFWKGQAVAVTAAAAAAALRWALLPVIGEEVSFATLFPAVLVSTLFAGWAGAFTTLLFGALASLAATEPAFGPSLALRLTPRFVAAALVGGLTAFIGDALRQTLAVLRRRQAELEAARDHLQVLTRELEHRGKNALAVVQGLSSITARTAPSVEAYREALERRLRALSRAYSLITNQTLRPTSLGALVRDVLLGFEGQIRILEGPSYLAQPDACVAFALTLHELATNAVKYGALSTEEGYVDVGWRVDAGGGLDFTWQERGGPSFGSRGVEGSGTRLLRTAFSAVPCAEVRLETRPEGVFCQVRLDPRQADGFSRFPDFIASASDVASLDDSAPAA